MNTNDKDSHQKMQYQKAFLVSEDTHKLVKSFCRKRNIKINMWVDSILKDIVDNNAKNKAEENASF